MRLFGVRILKPARSASLCTGRVLEVIIRIPFSQILSNGWIPLASISPRTYAPSLPSKARKAPAESLNAKPTL
jgi:hypothetical protein